MLEVVRSGVLVWIEGLVGQRICSPFSQCKQQKPSIKRVRSLEARFRAKPAAYTTSVEDAFSQHSRFLTGAL